MTFNEDGEARGLTEDEFLTVLDEVEAVYDPVFNELGKNLIVNRLWANDQVNASAQQQGRDWIINMFGGLARHEHATIDAFRAVACHEIGHHLGGAPKRSGWFGSWASNEGQSDYFATYKCMKKLILEGQKQGMEIASPDLSRYAELEVNLAESKCAERFSTAEPTTEVDIGRPEVDTAYKACVRSSLSGLSLGRLLGALKDPEKVISLSTPCLLYTSPSPRDQRGSRMPSSA